MKKLISILIAFAMMATLAVTAAFAAADPNDKNITVTKKLTIAQGLKAPENFTFTTTKVSYNDGTTAADKELMPDLGSITINMKDMTDTDADGYIQLTGTINTDQFTGKKNGVYVYTVAETQGNTEGMTYDQGTYTAKLLIKDGKVDSVVVVDDSSATGEKVDPKDPVDPETPNDGEPDKKANGVLFENLYKKTFADDAVAAEITKAVDGDYADATKQFPFTLTVDTSKTNYTGEAAAFTVVKGTTEIQAEQDGSYKFTLANGEKVQIKGAPVGTTYTVVEDLTGDAAAQKYYAGAVVKENDAEVAAKGITANAETKGGTPTVTGALIAENMENSVAYTNNLDDSSVTPTGILMSNLPYIVLALVAIGGLVAYVVVRRRNADEA